MMEKIFEELIEPFKKYENFWLFDLQQKELNEGFENQLKEFGKQVREATKKEDAEIADKYKSPHIAEAILNTQKDRILTP